MTTLVITGGSGRLGSMIARLAYEHWDDLEEIRLFDEKYPAEYLLSEFSTCNKPPRVTFSHGSVTNENSLLNAFAKANIVIHCAAIVDTGSAITRQKMEKVNAEGSLNVVQACLKSGGVQALVYTGSVAQVCSLKNGQPVEYDETHEPVPAEDLIFPHYGASKSKGEEFVLSANGQKGSGGVVLRTCSIRCPGMYGEGDTVFIGRIVGMAHHFFHNNLLVVGHSNEKNAPIAYLGNCAWAHIVAAQKLQDINSKHYGNTGKEMCNGSIATWSENTMGSTYSQVEGNFYYVADHTPKGPLVKHYGQFFNPLGLRVISLNIPLFLIWIIALLADYVSILLAFFSIDVYTPVNRSSLKYFRLDHGMSWERARKELGYEPIFDYETALSRSLVFYRQKYLNN